MLPGDLYKYVADHVWIEINKKVHSMSHAKVKECEQLIDNIIDRKTQIAATPPKSDRRKELTQELQAFKAEHAELLKEASPVFWHRITDNKQRRKLTKR